MVPEAVEPPVIPFTCQVTAWLVLLVTFAENCVVVPRRVSVAPEIVTAETGGETVPPFPFKLLPAQPAANIAADMEIPPNAFDAKERTLINTGKPPTGTRANLR
jgi:hypothetical protein